MYKSYDLLEKMCYVRVGGSQEELECAKMLENECKALGAEAHIESFEVDKAVIKKARLCFDGNIEVECEGVGMSSSTSEDGISGDFAYITCEKDAEITDIEGKICLVHTKLVATKLYRRLYEKKAAALVLCCGNVYNDKEHTDLDPYLYRERHYSIGKIPAVCIRMRDAEEILCKMPKTAKIVLLQEEGKTDSRNVVATVNGTEYPNEVIAFTAHYDSVRCSKGAYDNATGSTAIMQLLAFFCENKPKRTLKFIWCGSEENGLLGSKAYTASHKDELASYRFNINIDMLGVTLGYDIAVATADTDLVGCINYMGYEKGFAIAARQGVYSSDSTPFADNGIPSVSFARVSPSGGAEIHSRKDIMDRLSENNYYASCGFITSFADRLVNSVCFPVKKNIPDSMKDEIDYYYGRKDRPEK